MCGLAGFISPGLAGEGELRARAAAMAGELRHRGPDDSGVWVDPSAGVGLGFRRLAVQDLSPEGHQPMLSACGRYVVVFNGEIYNFSGLRRELEPRGHRFRGHSDTEVMLAAIAEWGLEAAVKRFVGMFAIALWDRQNRMLHLVRDRLGIKPLYYGWSGKTFLFASELKAIRAHPDFVSEIDRDALAVFLRHGYICQPHSIYRGILKLRPGSMLSLIAGTPPQQVLPRPYWCIEELARNGAAQPFSGTETEGIEHLDELLRDAVRLRMVADVPLGAFLSGGIDSSTVVALMQRQSSRSVKTFTIGFYEGGFNEAAHAKAVARHLGTDHTELYVSPAEARAVIPKLPTLYDEPFADSSQIPTFLISELARSRVTVSLSGDGGDELFGGYTRYVSGFKAWNIIRTLPQPARRFSAWVLRGVKPEQWKSLLQFLPEKRRSRLSVDRFRKLREVISATDTDSFYLTQVSHWRHAGDVLVGSDEPATIFTEVAGRLKISDFRQRAMLLDSVAYLPDDILTKLDRASMGVSLEARVPILDHRVVQFAASLPLSMKIHKGKGKYVLRKLLYRYVPESLVERPKMGFDVPIGAWLRAPLREWAEDLLNEARLRREGFLRPEVARRYWKEHLSGRFDWSNQLWDLLMLQAWLAEWGPPAGV